MDTEEKIEGETGGGGEGGKVLNHIVRHPLSLSPPLPVVTSINISPGGIPKFPILVANVTSDGIQGDGRAHAKHVKLTRAISLLEVHVIDAIRSEGYAVEPGAMGENLTVRGVDLQALAPGTRLWFTGGVEIELTEPRAPCFVLDAIHPDLKDAVRGRFGWMARVVTPGVLRAGEAIEVSSQVIAHSSQENLAPIF